MTKPTFDPRAQELLADRALDGLTREELDELARLGAADDASFDVAAAGLDLAGGRLEAMPAHVANKVLMAIDGVRSHRVPADQSGKMIDSARPRRRSAVIAWSAAAACLAAALGAWIWAGRREPEIVREYVSIMPTTPSPAEARAQLLATAQDATTLAWTATPDPAGKAASGDVVWSASAQRGFMRFKGLVPNDPTRLQYQLWIFDKDRDERFPVDGGVFDVGSNGEVIVPISAKLHVASPTLFAVTVEQPGGVVVSKRERIVVTAAPHA